MAEHDGGELARGKQARKSGDRFGNVILTCSSSVLASVLFYVACGGNVVVDPSGSTTGSTSSSGSTSSTTTSSSGCLDPTAPDSPCPLYAPNTGDTCDTPGLCCDYNTCTSSPPNFTCHMPTPSMATCTAGQWQYE
jgi:hypothetical protein